MRTLPFERIAAAMEAYALCLLDEDGHIVTWNAGAQRLEGYTEAEALGQHIALLFPGEADGVADQALAHARAKDHWEDHRWRVQKDGTRFWAHTVLAAVRDDEDTLQGFACITNDLTTQRRYEQDLEASRTFAESIVATVREPLVVLDDDLRIASVNRSFRHTFQVTEEETVGHFLYDLGNSQWDIPELRTLLSEVLPQDIEVVDYEVRHGFPELGSRVMLLNARHLPRPGLEQDAILLAIEDVTERVEHEQALQRYAHQLEQYAADLQQTNKELDDFAYVASHDLKSPLRNLDNLAQWIAEDVGDDLPEASKRHLELMQNRVQRMEHLLDDLLAYSRAGRKEYPVEAIDAGELIREVVELLAPPKSFSVETMGEMPVLHTTRPPLQQVFMNLIGNAIKHHDRTDGRVTIFAEPESDPVLFTVADDGPGIAPEYHQRIFGMFQTLRPRDEVEGSGMGLALVKKLVEHAGGTIALDSEKGRGVTFYFTWPLDERPPDDIP